MIAKEIIRAILRATTLITLFVVLLGIVGYLYEWVEIEETLWNTIFWSIACGLTALKIAFIKEDF